MAAPAVRPAGPSTVSSGGSPAGPGGGPSAVPDVRTRVLAAAVELFATQGYEATSVAEVVAAAGVAKGGFYHHFASKQDLLYDVYGDLIGRQLAALDEIVARGLPAPQTLRLVIDDLVVSTARSARQAVVFWREMHRLTDERAARYRRSRRRYHDTVRRIVRDGQAAGLFDTAVPADTVTLTIFGVVNELPVWYRPTGRTRPAQFARELADFVLRGLGADDREGD